MSADTVTGWDLLRNQEISEYMRRMGCFPPQVELFMIFQRIRLKHINEMLGQCEERTDAIAVLTAKKKAIEEFLGQ